MGDIEGSEAGKSQSKSKKADWYLFGRLQAHQRILVCNF